MLQESADALRQSPRSPGVFRDSWRCGHRICYPRADMAPNAELIRTGDSMKWHKLMFVLPNAFTVGAAGGGREGAPVADRADAIRNVALVGAGGSVPSPESGLENTVKNQIFEDLFVLELANNHRGKLERAPDRFLTFDFGKVQVIAGRLFKPRAQESDLNFFSCQH